MKIQIAVGGLVVAAGLLFGAAAVADEAQAGDRGAYADRSDSSDRSAYSYVRAMIGEATVNSRWNGAVEARRNMPISVGDEISVAQGGRVEIGMADGNIVFLGGGTRVAIEALSDQQGEQDEYSAVHLFEGDLAISGLGVEESRIPRVDTDDATVYLSSGSHVRINSDPRRGTVVVGRAGTVEVRTRAGTYSIKAGQYLMARGDEEPEISRGAFSRDRFDIWVADRLESVQDVRSASVRYVGDQYASDVAALDGYGDWEYDSSYGGNVWSPRVDADWSPYSYGSWYYTPAGLTWWSYDPWGWYPSHYGNWFHARNRWCWAPGYVYSPAWVYWGYSSGYVGWCPIGYYSNFSPWGTYYRHWGVHPRSNLYFAINGNFQSNRVDWRGWNFTGAGSFGTVTRASVIPGSRIGDRLGAQVAISSRPIVVNTREGGVREAIRSYVREAPRTIERTAGAGSERLAPVLSRERTLPADTVAALRERAVIAERGRLAGPAASELAPRGGLVERSRTAPSGALTNREPPGADRRSLSTERAPVVGNDHSAARIAPRTADDSWRGRLGSQTVAPAPPAAVRTDTWRSRTEVPPAQRVIEGAVPNRRAPEARAESGRGRDFRTEAAPRVERAPVDRGPALSPPSTRIERAPNIERRERIERSPYPVPQPRVERYSPPSPPSRVERAPYSPPAHVERAPAPAPAPRAEVHREAPQHPAPEPHPQRERPH
jgi:uncharacterized protein DUF6600